MLPPSPAHLSGRPARCPAQKLTIARTHARGRSGVGAVARINVLEQAIMHIYYSEFYSVALGAIRRVAGFPRRLLPAGAYGGSVALAAADRWPEQSNSTRLEEAFAERRATLSSRVR